MAITDHYASSEYVRDLIREDQDRQHFRGLLQNGATSPSAATADPAWFDVLRRRVQRDDMSSR